MGVDPDRLCKCDRMCGLLPAERRRGSVICRYRHGEVKPVSYFAVPTQCCGMTLAHCPCGVPSSREEGRS